MPRTKKSTLSRLKDVANGLNARQQAYLLAAYAEDQRRENSHRSPGAPPARQWRWIEYGPVGAKFLDRPGVFLLRRVLEKDGLVDQGTGATWTALAERGCSRRGIPIRFPRRGLSASADRGMRASYVGSCIISLYME